MKHILSHLVSGETLCREEAHELMLDITREQYTDIQIAAMLTAIQMRGATVDELLGLRDGLLETGKYIDLGPEPTLDIVGTGGDQKNTFNISTCAAFVIAGAGFRVSKHGNGVYRVVNNLNDVKKSIRDEYPSLVNIIAKDVKAQVEFNPETVESYRLLGFENRELNHEDFTSRLRSRFYGADGKPLAQ